ncbi:MAG TPA: glutamate-1-semialdehyde 2,1-aminomutase [Candidatus Lustribacter sp.]|nr:glutamate-1-semialdehyde 2,1-aminomutase [Candidatus Lustribacter sp.]
MTGTVALAGGASSPVRTGWGVGGAPYVAVRGAGAYSYDASGRRSIDYVMAYGPLLFGHGHPAFSTGLDAIAARGAVTGSTHPDELLLAERIRAHLPSMERLRFATTGSEAVQGAVRVARAFTGRDAVLKFAGNYHGHFDLALQDAGASAHTVNPARSGIPAAVAGDLVVARYNDLADVDARLAQTGARLAAILVEPVVGNMGLVVPEPDFLAGLRARAHAAGALLIFDEVITWLRLGLGGAQARAGIVPDLTTVGKILGGGFPLAAFGGRADVMAVLAPGGPCFTGGTHAGNPFAVAMGLRVLDWLEQHPQAYAAMDRRAQRLAAGIRGVVEHAGCDFAVLQLESIVDFKFRRGGPNRNYDDARAANRDAYAAYYHEMLQRGVLLPPSQNEVMFLCTEHSDADVDETIAAIAGAFTALESRGLLEADYAAAATR